MAIIGNNSAGTASHPLEITKLELVVLNAHRYTAAANQEVWKLWIDEYIGTNGSTVEIGVYDVTTSQVNATLVASGSVNSANSAGWISVEITPVALIAGHDYVVAAVASAVNFLGGHTDWNAESYRGQTIAALPATLATTNTGTYAVSMYAETRDATSGSAIEVTSVNSGNTVADGDASVNIAGIDFDAITNIVTISPTTDINHASAVIQSVVTTNSTTSIDITVDLPTGSSDADPVYLFVEDASSNISISFSVSVTPVDTTPLTLLLTDDGLDTGAQVPCTSTDFALGMTVDVYRGATPAVKETATTLTELSNENTGTPQYTAIFPNGDPVSGDTVKYSYDATVGNIVAVTGGQPLASFIDKESATVCV